MEQHLLPSSFIVATEVKMLYCVLLTFLISCGVTLAEPNTESTTPDPDWDVAMDVDVDPTQDDIGILLVTTVYDSFATSKYPRQKSSKSSVPDIEFKKLKAAVKATGLSDAKADRVVRTVKGLEMRQSEILNLKQLMLNPTTTTAYADRISQALEDSLVDRHLKLSLVQNHNSPLLSRGRLDPLTMQKLYTAAQLSDLDAHSCDRLLHAVIDADLDKAQAGQIIEVIQRHAASPADLTILINHLEENDLREYRKTHYSSADIPNPSTPIHHFNNINTSHNNHRNNANNNRNLVRGGDEQQEGGTSFHPTPVGAKGADWIFEKSEF